MEFGIKHDKYEQFDKWYRDILTRCKLISYYDISGCYILLPNSYQIWEKIVSELDTFLKRENIENCYFPMLITEDNLMKEKEHLEAFNPEVAWVTHKGDSELEKKLALRPTSETAMYPFFKDMIRSNSDLPLKLNQYCNVVRYEFSDCTPFIRSREFLWSEVHCCFETSDQAIEYTHKMINVYEDIYKNLLCIPTIRGKKTEKEKFAGADMTLTLEAFLDGANRAVQCCTSHYLGTNFSKIYDVTYYSDENKRQNNVYQISAGITTRSIGVLLMQHSDNKGLVLPFGIAKNQIVIVPIYNKNNKIDVLNYCKVIKEKLHKFRICIDDSNRSVGYKCNDHELFGVPFLIKIGKNEVKNGIIALKSRLNTTNSVNFSDLENSVEKLANEYNNNLYQNALTKLRDSIQIIESFEECEKFENKIYEKKFCGNMECENIVKQKYKIKSLCVTRTDNDTESNTLCCMCNNHQKYVTMFGKSF